MAERTSGPEGALPTGVRGKPPKGRPLLRLAAALLIGAALGRLLFWLGEVLGLSPQKVSHRVLLALGTLLLALLVLSLWARRRSRFARECAALMPLLESDADAYIAGYEALRGRWRGAVYRRTICLNLTAGYHERGDWDAALSLLHEAASCGLPGPARTVWAADLAMNAFRRERWEEGMSILEREKEALGRLSELEAAGAPCVRELLGLYRLIAQGEQEQARRWLASIEERYTGPRAQKSLSHIREVLERPTFFSREKGPKRAFSSH